MTKIGKLLSNMYRPRRDGGASANTAAATDGGAALDGAAGSALPRRTNRRRQQSADSPPTLPPRNRLHTPQQLAALAGTAPPVPPRPMPDAVRQNLINAVRQTTDARTVSTGTQTVPLQAPTVIYVTPTPPTMVDASTQTEQALNSDRTTQTERPPQLDGTTQTDGAQRIDAQLQAGGSRLPRKRPAELNADVWREIASVLVDGARSTGGPSGRADEDSLKGLSSLTMTGKTMRANTLSELYGLQIEEHLHGDRVDVSLSHLLQVLGTRADRDELRRTIRSLPATTQVAALIQLLRLAARTSNPMLSDSTRHGLIPELIDTIADLPRAQAAQVLSEGIVRLHDIDPPTARMLLGQPGTQQAGTVQWLPAQDQLPILEFLADNWQPTLQQRAGLREIILALPADVGEALQLFQGIIHAHDSDPAAARSLLGQPGTQEAGTVQALPAQQRVRILQFLANHWEPTLQQRAGLRDMILALPAGVGETLKARFRT
jgi:hypothetical protein